VLLHIPPWTWVTSGNEDEIGRKGHRTLNATDCCHPVFQGLPHNLQSALVKLRKLVQEQYTVMGQRHLTRTWPLAAPHKSGVTDGVVGRPKGTIHDQRSVGREQSGHTVDGIERASRVLPAPGGPDMMTLCPPAEATSSARLTCS
jgi:hypothetical protein